ncbi:MAG: hypothetical protein U5L11_12570 [Arhodomonas sp.]|nr:hypothetical protein [Arhodomonas sp.]
MDGLAVSSFTLAPTPPVGFTQYVWASRPRWLEHIPTGGACGVVALRRAARAVQCGDAEVVACLAGDTANFGSFRGLMQNFSLHHGCRTSSTYGRWRPQRELRADRRSLHARVRGHARGLRADRGEPAGQCRGRARTPLLTAPLTPGGLPQGAAGGRAD